MLPDPTFRIPRILCLDFDGVLHPSTEVSDFPSTGLPLLAYIQTRTQLLRWAPLLHEALKGSKCEVLVHSSWRNEILDGDLRRLLEPSGLADRFIGSAPKGMRREAAITEVQKIMGIDDAELLILDDAIAEFDRLKPRLIACNPLLGISDPAILSAIAAHLTGVR